MKMGSYGLKQVIFLIDTTASVAPYWADLKKYYIFPIINFFNNSEVPTKGKSCHMTHVTAHYRMGFLRVVQTQAILFLKSISERESDIERL